MVRLKVPQHANVSVRVSCGNTDHWTCCRPNIQLKNITRTGQWVSGWPPESRTTDELNDTDQEEPGFHDHNFFLRNYWFHLPGWYWVSVNVMWKLIGWRVSCPPYKHWRWRCKWNRWISSITSGHTRLQLITTVVRGILHPFPLFPLNQPLWRCNRANVF